MTTLTRIASLRALSVPQSVVKVWFHSLGKTSSHRKLTYLYLANDVVQNSKKKSPEIAREFGTVMKKVMEHLAVLALDERTVRSIDRLLSIWTERDIFEKALQGDLNRIWATKKLELAAAADDDEDKADKEAEQAPPPKKAKKGESGSVEGCLSCVGFPCYPSVQQG